MSRRLPGWLTPAVTRAVHLTARWTRPLTLGVRAVIVDGEGRVFLVRHSYIRGWHLPGGAVEPGETVEDAVIREVREEASLAVEGRPALHGMFFNRGVSRRDHVIVYVVHRFRAVADAPAGFEIAERGFFRPDALPEGTTGATRRRLAEIAGREPAADW